jgi:urease alpha subunit
MELTGADEKMLQEIRVSMATLGAEQFNKGMRAGMVSVLETLNHGLDLGIPITKKVLHDLEGIANTDIGLSEGQKEMIEKLKVKEP